MEERGREGGRERKKNKKKERLILNGKVGERSREGEKSSLKSFTFCYNFGTVWCKFSHCQFKILSF
jgi:hypothetical protein